MAILPAVRAGYRSFRWSLRCQVLLPELLGAEVAVIGGGEQSRGGEVRAVAVVVVETIGFEVFLWGQEAGRELGQMG